MKASPRQQRLLLQLQELDTQHQRLARRVAQLPERAELDALAEKARHARVRFMDARRAHEELQADVGRIESELETVRQRYERSSQRLGASTQAKEASALQEELTLLTNRKELLEERQLELMERGEEAEAAYTVAAAAVEDIDGAMQELREAISRSEQSISEELTALKEHRASIAAEVQGPVLDIYERTRDRYGIGAARLRGRVSEGSNMELDPADYQAAKDAPADELYFCPTSGAILVRDAEESQVE